MLVFDMLKTKRDINKNKSKKSTKKIERDVRTIFAISLLTFIVVKWPVPRTPWDRHCKLFSIYQTMPSLLGEW